MSSMTLRVGFTVAVAAAVIMPSATSAEPKNEPRKEAKATIERKIAETRVKKDVFTGTEFRVTALNYVNADCSSGPVPDMRIVTQPANGEIRTEQIRYIVDRTADNSRHHCNGKEVDALGVFYKSRDGFTGQDQIAVDVDFRNGRVQRYLYVIAVR